MRDHAAETGQGSTNYTTLEEKISALQTNYDTCELEKSDLQTNLDNLNQKPAPHQTRKA